MTGAPETPSPAAILYPSAAKPDAPAATPGSTAQKPAATSQAPAAPPPAAQLGKGTWQAPRAAPSGTAATASPGTAAQPATKAAEPSASPAIATLYAEPMKNFADVVVATPLPEGDAEAAGFDTGEEGKAAREAVRSAFLSSGASAAETSELWGIAVEAARPDCQPQTYEAAEHDLRAAWGADYDSRLNRARTLMRDVARKHPAVAAEVKKLGLDNSASFIAAVEKAARRRGR
ncbi:hypothetical protein [Falsiroseomonas sp.]|uniref:hypothetical protein n=1 Tax=Falsiroseomonas sp. TaxID=2870721 RepID=UPI003567674E